MSAQQARCEVCGKRSDAVTQIGSGSRMSQKMCGACFSKAVNRICGKADGKRGKEPR